MPIRAIVFDIDGTLYPDWSLYLRHLDFGLRHSRRLRQFGAARSELHRLAIDPEARPRLPTDRAGFRALQASVMARIAGIGEDEAFAWAEEVMYRELEDGFADIRLYPGALPAIDAIRALGLPVAALSDFPAPRKLELLRIRDRFDHAFCSEETGRLKPAPEPFLLVASALGVIPEEILFVGNSLRLDIAGAKGVGMFAALRSRSLRPRAKREPYIPKGLGGERSAEPDLIFGSWRRFSRILTSGRPPLAIRTPAAPARA